MDPERPTPRQLAQLAGKTGLGIRTLYRLYDGSDSLVSTREVATAGARELGMPEPPAPSPRREAAEADGK